MPIDDEWLNAMREHAERTRAEGRNATHFLEGGGGVMRPASLVPADDLIDLIDTVARLRTLERFVREGNFDKTALRSCIGGDDDASDRTVPYEETTLCDACGAVGAFDFMGDSLCGKCASDADDTELPR